MQNRETLMIHTGDSQQKRKEFLNDIYTKAEPFSGIPWQPKQIRFEKI